MNLATTWWVIAGLLVAAELASGTFYLLMLAVGCAAGALTAHLGFGPAIQLIVAAALGGSAVLVVHRWRGTKAASLPAMSNPDVNLDIGQTVDVKAWSADSSCAVSYRGAQWQGRFVGTDTPEPGKHRITGIQGSCLLLDR